MLALNAFEKRYRERGSILIFVMLMLFLGAAIVVSFKFETFARIRYFSSQYERDDLRLMAYSQLELVLAVMSEIKQVENSLNSPGQGWGYPYEYARLGQPPEGVTIEVKDEGAKLPLEGLTEDRLLNLFEEMGFDYDVRQDLLACYLDWTDEDDLERLGGADTDHYEGLENPYLPANGPIKSFRELALIETFKEHFFNEETGEPNGRYQAFTEAVSIYNTGKVNINTASNLVLQTLARESGFDSQFLVDYLAGDDGVRFTKDDEIIASDGDYGFPGGAEFNTDLLGYSTDVVEIKITVRDGGGGVFTLNALFGTAGAAEAGAVRGSDNNANNTGNNNNARNRRNQSNTRTAKSDQSEAASQLNYPFEYIRISENFEF